LKAASSACRNPKAVLASLMTYHFYFYFYYIRGRLQLTEDSANYVRYCASGAIIYNFSYKLTKTIVRG
jgi:hypothetical protein